MSHGTSQVSLSTKAPQATHSPGPLTPAMRAQHSPPTRTSSREGNEVCPAPQKVHARRSLQAAGRSLPQGVCTHLGLCSSGDTKISRELIGAPKCKSAQRQWKGQRWGSPRRRVPERPWPPKRTPCVGANFLESCPLSAKGLRSRFVQPLQVFSRFQEQRLCKLRERSPHRAVLEWPVLLWGKFCDK